MQKKIHVEHMVENAKQPSQEQATLLGGERRVTITLKVYADKLHFLTR